MLCPVSCCCLQIPQRPHHRSEQLQHPVTIIPAAILQHSASAALTARCGAGVLNLVTGSSSQIGNEMLSNESVRKIGFTGSTPIGKHLLAGASDTVKRVSMELGGNAPLLVFEDADLELAADGVIASGLRNAGQTCICANRILVQVRSHGCCTPTRLPGSEYRQFARPWLVPRQASLPPAAECARSGVHTQVTPVL